MWRNYLAVGIRVLLRNRVYAFVNIMGLALGIAAATLVFIYVRMESSYDRWLPHADRLVQLQSILNPAQGAASRSATAPRVAADALRREFPEFEQIVGVTRARTAIVFDGEPRLSLVYWTDSNFFDVFDLRFLRGDRTTALRDLNSVVLTRQEAERYFGSANPIGRTIMVNRYGEDQPLRVTGVLADLPPNTHLDLGMICPFQPGNRERLFVDLVDRPERLCLRQAEAGDRHRPPQSAHAGFRTAQPPDRTGRARPEHRSAP